MQAVVCLSLVPAIKHYVNEIDIKCYSTTNSYITKSHTYFGFPQLQIHLLVHMIFKLLLSRDSGLSYINNMSHCIELHTILRRHIQ